MPPKIRELIAELERNGFVNRGGKGSHRNFEHPKGFRIHHFWKRGRRRPAISGKAGSHVHRDFEAQMKSIADKYQKIVYWSDEDNCFIGVCPEFFLGGVHGSGPQEVFRELLEVVDEWVEIFEKDGRPLPEPKNQVVGAV